IGFAHLLRRSLFLRLGGYRESFQFYGEEKEYCLRLLSAGCQVVYLPHARVVHMAALVERDHSRYLRFTIRNDCLAAVYNEPFPLPLLTVPLRLLRYFKMRGDTPDPGGLQWIVRELARKLPTALSARPRRDGSRSTRRRGRLRDGPAGRIAPARPDAAFTGEVRLLRAVVHRVRAPDPPRRVLAGRRLSRDAALPRRGERVLPAPDRRGLRHRVHARAGRPRRRSDEPRSHALSEDGDSQRLPRIVAQRAVADAVRQHSHPARPLC